MFSKNEIKKLKEQAFREAIAEMKAENANNFEVLRLLDKIKKQNESDKKAGLKASD